MFRFLHELPLSGHHLFDGFEQLVFALEIELQVQPDPFAKIVKCTRHGQFGDGDGHVPSTNLVRGSSSLCYQLSCRLPQPSRSG